MPYWRLLDVTECEQDELVNIPFTAFCTGHYPRGQPLADAWITLLKRAVSSIQGGGESVKRARMERGLAEDCLSSWHDWTRCSDSLRRVNAARMKAVSSA